MSTSYDESIFGRDWNSFSISQRFSENYQKFYGTLKTAIQMVLANTIMGQIPQPLCYFLLFFYFFTLVTLGFLTAKGLWSQKNGDACDDSDLVDVITS